jgi:hypothetical protein
MLMPILTVKMPATASQAAIVVEAAAPKERAVPVPLRISGNQSEAALKILEAVNRHLVGSEPLPKEALIRLLDTLSKILKFPPLPQESLRDFSKRLAVYLETLPPASRLALEKELLQRNLVVSIKVLAEALKSLPPLDAPRLLEKLLIPSPIVRGPTVQPDGKAPPGLPVPHGQATVPGRQPQLPAAQILAAAPALVADPGLLQAALKRAFSDDDATPAMDESEAEGLAATGRGGDQPAKTATARGNGGAAASAQPQQGKTNSETIPLLRAAAAFLAADPEALSQVSAITAGDIDSRIMEELKQELGLDLSEQHEELEPAGTHLHEGDNLSGRVGEPEAEAKSSASTGRLSAQRQLNEVDGFKGHDLGEWELEATTDSQIAAAEMENQLLLAEPEMDRPAQALAQSLKALVEASLPLPGGAAEELDTLFATLAGETADMGAEILFAQLDEMDAMQDMGLLTGSTGDQAEQLGLEADAWNTLLDGPDEKAAARQALAPHSGMDEGAREAQAPRLLETGIVRDAVPFAMIPYLPAKTPEARSIEIDEEEKQAFADEEDQGQQGEDGGQPESRGEDVPSPVHQADTDLEEPGSDGDAAYDLYRRMGGYG